MMLSWFKRKPTNKVWVGNIAASYVDDNGKTTHSFFYILYIIDGKKVCTFSKTDDEYIRLAKQHIRYVNYIIPWLNSNYVIPDDAFFHNQQENNEPETPEKKPFTLLTFPKNEDEG